MRIVLTNIERKYNFGGPSLLYGMINLINIIEPGKKEIYLIECSVDAVEIQDVYEIEERTYYPFEKRYPWRHYFGYNGIPGISSAKKCIEKADVVIDLHGICFCDKLVMKNWNRVLYGLLDYQNFTISYIAKKKYNKLCIKNSASYGPIGLDYNVYSAKRICTNIFDVIFAREKKSRYELQKIGLNIDNISICPDIANLMPYSEVKERKNEVCISVSHQVRKQWTSKEPYEKCIIDLCKHIVDKYRSDITLVANEYSPYAFNDLSLAENIHVTLKNIGIENNILNPNNHSAMEIKNHIASCRVMVSSRYHSCVAALSSNTPTLVIGWHNKYDELLSLYNQEEWILSSSSCNTDKLIALFDVFWNNYDNNLRKISESFPQIKNQIIEKYIEVWKSIK